MLRRMEAEVLFLNPGDLNQGCAALIEAGFEIEVLDDRIDDYGPAIWIMARTSE